jgi:hypothetical protein
MVLAGVNKGTGDGSGAEVDEERKRHKSVS